MIGKNSKNIIDIDSESADYSKDEQLADEFDKIIEEITENKGV
jgi:hypothetical protein